MAAVTAITGSVFGLAVPEGEPSRAFPVNYAFRELRVNAEPRLVRGYAERSLRNLGIDVIDLLPPLSRPRGAPRGDRERSGRPGQRRSCAARGTVERDGGAAAPHPPGSGGWRAHYAFTVRDGRIIRGDPQYAD